MIRETYDSVPDDFVANAAAVDPAIDGIPSVVGAPFAAGVSYRIWRQGLVGVPAVPAVVDVPAVVFEPAVVDVPAIVFAPAVDGIPAVAELSAIDVDPALAVLLKNIIF